MSKHYLKYILPLLLLLNSCSYLIKMEEQQASLVDKVQSQKTVICIPSNKQISVVSSNSNAVTSYLGAIKKISKDNNLSLTDKFVLLALWQMNLRPDLSSPYSHLQLLHTVNGKSNYTSFTPIASQMTEDDVVNFKNSTKKAWKKHRGSGPGSSAAAEDLDKVRKEFKG